MYAKKKEKKSIQLQESWNTTIRADNRTTGSRRATKKIQQIVLKQKKHSVLQTALTSTNERKKIWSH